MLCCSFSGRRVHRSGHGGRDHEQHLGRTVARQAKLFLHAAALWLVGQYTDTPHVSYISQAEPIGPWDRHDFGSVQDFCRLSLQRKAWDRTQAAPGTSRCRPCALNEVRHLRSQTQQPSEFSPESRNRSPRKQGWMPERPRPLGNILAPG